VDMVATKGTECLLCSFSIVRQIHDVATWLDIGPLLFDITIHETTSY
jgi:hypothetical protein